MKDEAPESDGTSPSSVFILHPSSFILSDMISLTRLNGTEFVLNAEKIRWIEATPDTLINTDSGDKLVVKETVQEVVRRSIDYARQTRRPLTE